MKKILVLQLARLGDIYMTWPVLRALKRAHPGARIDVMTRPRFQGALDGLDAVDQRKLLPTEELLEPLLREEWADEEALERFDYYLESLRAENYDLILNLSFSPFSSYLTHLIQGPSTRVLGYSRHSDGWLSITDDVSSYFYAQVGIGRANRVHLTDIFAAVANVDLVPEDWARPSFLSEKFESGAKGPVVIHVAASEARKTLAPFQWARVIRLIDQKAPRTHFALLGAESEKGLAQEILAQVPGVTIESHVGRDSLQGSFGLLHRARLLVGADSAPMHMASLTGTPSLNLSFSGVNFWETGPRAPGSRVLLSHAPTDASSERISDAVVAMLKGEECEGTIPFTDGIPCYAQTPLTERGDFSWRLLKAMYLGDEFPVVDSLEFVEAVQKLNDMNSVVLENLEKGGLETSFLGQLIDRADEVMGAVARLQEEAGVFVRWIQAEKSRVPPSSMEAVKGRMKELHGQFQGLLKPYVFNDEQQGQGNGAV